MQYFTKLLQDFGTRKNKNGEEAHKSNLFSVSDQSFRVDLYVYFFVFFIICRIASLGAAIVKRVG